MNRARLPSPVDRHASFAAESDYGTMYNIISGKASPRWHVARLYSRSLTI
jgi:hypothetical protein